MSAAIEVTDLVIRYPSSPSPITAVDGVTLHAATGSVCTLLGPNGAGKTSTVEAMEGYRAPSAGSVRVLGLDPVRDAKQLLPRIGVMLQRNGVYVTMSPRDAIRLFAKYYPGRALDPDETLDRVGLSTVAATPWRRLSGGEQQRLSLALALIGRPEVVFLDEPTAGIDAQARLTVRELIRELRDDGVTVLLTTHDLDEAKRVSDRIVIIDHGKVVGDGTPDELLRSGDNTGIRFGAPTGLDVHALAGAVGGQAREERVGEYVVDIAPSPTNVAAITTWLAQRDVAIDDLRAGRQSLEDVFLRLTAETESTTNTTNTATTATTTSTAVGTANQSSRGRRGRRSR